MGSLRFKYSDNLMLKKKEEKTNQEPRKYICVQMLFYEVSESSLIVFMIRVQGNSLETPIILEISRNIQQS